MKFLKATIGSTLDALGVKPDSCVRQTLNDRYNKCFSRPKKIQPFLSFSQFGEDAFVSQFFDRDVGTYVDVGSGHPVRGSNTYSFYLMGWSGVLVEPIALNVELARKTRPRDVIHQRGCGAGYQSLRFHEFNVYEHSTTDGNRAHELQMQEGLEIVNTYDIETVPLSALGLQATPVENTLLSIDVEGSELAVLESNDWDRHLPRVIIVEDWISPLEQLTPVQEYLLSLDYQLEGVLGISSVYRFSGRG